MSEPSILERIQSDMVAAMKARDADTLSTLRMLKAALTEAKTRKPRDARLTSDQEVEVLQRYVKKRRETIAELEKAGRRDLIAREEQEIAVTGRYLPRALGEDELRALIRDEVARLGAATPQEAGKVIGAVMGQVRGRTDGGTVSRLVRETLGG